MVLFSLYPQIQSSFPSLTPIAASLRLNIAHGRMGTVTLALSLLAVVLLCPATATLRIGAFNIQAFGDTKMSNEGVTNIIVNVSATSASVGQDMCWTGPEMWLLCQDMDMDEMASQCPG